MKSFSDRMDELMDKYEEEKGKRITQNEIAKKIGFDDPSKFSKILHEKRNIQPEEAQALSELFDVPIEVILGKMDLSEIKPIDKHGLDKLTFLSRKWIFDNSKNEDTKNRVVMLNRILCNPQIANLLFDMLYAYVVGFPVSMRFEQDTYAKQDIEQALFKNLIIDSNFDIFLKDIYKRCSDIREKRTEKKVNDILERFENSKKTLEEARRQAENQEAECIVSDTVSGAVDMILNNKNLAQDSKTISDNGTESALSQNTDTNISE